MKLYPKCFDLTCNMLYAINRHYENFVYEITSILSSVLAPYPKEKKFQFKILVKCGKNIKI